MVLFVTQFAIVLICIGIGGRFGGIGTGAAGGLGLAILTLVLDSLPTHLLSLLFLLSLRLSLASQSSVRLAGLIYSLRWQNGSSESGRARSLSSAPQSLIFLLLSAEQDMLPFRFIQSLLKLQQMPEYGQREPCRCQ